MDVLAACLVFLLEFAVVWLVNFLLAAMAYRVNAGSRPLDLELPEFWFRSALAGLLLTSYIMLALLLASVLVLGLGLGEGKPESVPTAFLWLMAPYLVVAPFIFHWAFGLDDDPLGAISLFLIHHFLPGFVLLLVALFFGTQLALVSRLLG